MTKMNWDRAKYRPGEQAFPRDRSLDNADRWLAKFGNRKRHKASKAFKTRFPTIDRAAKISVTPRLASIREVAIVIGEQASPSGRREVHIFSDVAAAHRAGFTFAV